MQQTLLAKLTLLQILLSTILESSVEAQHIYACNDCQYATVL